MNDETPGVSKPAISPLQRVVIAAIALLMGVAGFATGRTMLRPASDVIQPIAFNHQLHTQDQELECDMCHEYLTVGQHAGLPTLTTCLMCHEEPMTESSEEARIIELSASGQDDVFRKLFSLPAHAYYSHRRHAVVAEIACTTCHGAIAETTVPPVSPLVRIDMDFCIDCHRRESVNESCTSCHR